MKFKDSGAEDIFNGEASKASRKVLPTELHGKAAARLDTLANATSLQDLARIPGAHLEALKGGRKGQHSVRINDQLRVCFVWSRDGAIDVEIVDYH